VTGPHGDPNSIQEVGGETMEVPAMYSRVPVFDPGKREHFWVVQLTYHLVADAIRPDHVPLLDRENLVNVSPPMCWYCEREHSRKLAALPCPGDLRQP
jgi:hypothetical protein